MPFRSMRKKLFFSLVAATLCFGVTMIVFVQTVVRDRLVHQLQQQGVVIAKKVASDAVSPVITERYFEVSMMFKDLQAADGSVVYAYVVDEEGRELAHTFASGVPSALKQAHVIDPLDTHSIRELRTDRGPVLDIGVPLLRGQAGLLHVGFSLTSIRRDVNRIVVLIVLATVLALLVGIAASVGLSQVLTRPLVTLAAAAERFGRGEAQQPVIVRSDDEVGELARVFNDMMESRRQAADEQAKLIEELRRTLAEVKTLRGFLPICASCKKIRSDEGYWQQLETYITEHSEAEFSHGLCPDCGKALYPEIWASLQKEKDKDQNKE